MLDWLDRAQLEAHSVDLRQFIAFRPARLESGIRIIEAYNASGLTFSLLPDRGLDIWAAHYNGIPLTWLSQGSPHPGGPEQDWLRQFNGGLLTTCGLTHAGPPEKDLLTGAPRGLHGRYTWTHAGAVSISGGWQDDGYHLALSGTMTQGALFGEQLRMERTVRLKLGTPALTIEDRVTNVSPDTATPLMVLYHINLGYPLVRAGTELEVAHHAVYPRDAEAAFGFERWSHYDAASAAYDEQVFFHQPLVDAEGQAHAALLQDGFGLELAWDARALPYLTQWKNTRQGIYVSGLEPGNCIPEGQNAARVERRLAVLEPGADQTFRWTLGVLDGDGAVDACRARISALRDTGTPAENCRLDDFATRE